MQQSRMSIPDEHGDADATAALKAQEQDPTARELSFLERLGLLIDQQWTWRENQALARRLHAGKLKGACVEDIDYRTSRGTGTSVITELDQKSGRGGGQTGGARGDVGSVPRSGGGRRRQGGVRALRRAIPAGDHGRG